MEARKAIGLSMTTRDLMVTMAEGNPGALSVIVALAKRQSDPPAVMLLLDLDDMNMRGEQIWVAFKNHCQQDIEAFAKAIQGHDPAMVRTVNAECSPRHVAVEHGASFERQDREIERRRAQRQRMNNGEDA